MTEDNRRILVVDDNRAIHADFRKILQRTGGSEMAGLASELFGLGLPAQRHPDIAFCLSSAYQGADGVEMVRAAHDTGQPYALAIVDMRMPPGLDGVQTIEKMWEIDPDLQVVICTAFSDASWEDIVQRLGTTDRLLILKKPFDLVEVCQLALALTEKWKLVYQARTQMAELVRSRADLAASLALARAVQESTLDGILVVGRDGKVSSANKKFFEMWTIPPELIVARDDDLMLTYVLDQLADKVTFLARVHHLYDHPEESGSDELRLLDGRIFERWSAPVSSDDGLPQGRLWCFRDVTERRRLESDRAVVTERMASMGRLAAGVGHEINNPLTFVLGNVDHLLESCHADAIPGRTELTESLQETRGGLERIRVIVRDLQMLTRSDETAMDVDLNQLVDQAIQIARAEVRHRAPIVRKYEPVPKVHGNATRLGQVFLNLIINAAQAIPDGNVRSHRIEIAIRNAGTHSLVEVTDTGAGIAAENLDRIFDPFFTTKAVGVGTGLGLAISREIVTGHRGTLTVKSTLGVGTTMTVMLPHSTGAASVPTRVEVAPSASRRGRVLVIDDELPIARTLQRALGSRHQVVVASDPRDALARIACGETFDLILCDLMMPEMSGIDLHELLAREHPTIAARMIFMTGGAFTSKAEQFLSNVKNERIDKPFSISHIKEIVERFLEIGSRAAAGVS